VGALLEFDQSRDLDSIALGRICIDINPVDYYQKWGDCTTFRKYVGGSPANTAVGMARLGKKVGFIGCISADQLGDYCIDVFTQEGIDTSGIVRARHGESLGLAFTEILSETASSLVMYRDHVADLQLEADDVSPEYIHRTKLLIVSGTALAASPSREAALQAIEIARQSDTVIAFDIDYRPYTWASESETALYYALAARYAHIIMGSREEWDILEGRKKNEWSDQEIADSWVAEKARLVIIKHGSAGSHAFSSDGKAYQVRPFPVKVIKSFGGGDGYSSALLSGLLEGLPLATCLELANASAAISVSSHGISTDMGTMDTLHQFIAEKKAQFGEVVHLLNDKEMS
jgi:5-dehydro-2-deoxygluconokinase